MGAVVIRLSATSVSREQKNILHRIHIISTVNYNNVPSPHIHRHCRHSHCLTVTAIVAAWLSSSSSSHPRHCQCHSCLTIAMLIVALPSLGCRHRHCSCRFDFLVACNSALHAAAASLWAHGAPLAPLR